MADTLDVSAWILLYAGLYSFAASIGEWRAPGYWAGMLADFERSPGLRFVTGFFVLSVGAAIYLVNPWRPDDWMSVVVTLLGGIMTLEGAAILAIGDRFLAFSRWLISRASRAWALFSTLLGFVLIAASLIRLDVF